MPLRSMVDNEETAPKPKREPDKQIRGRLDVWNEEGQYAFSAYQQRPDMRREVIHDRHGVKLAKTQGEKESSYLLSVKIDGQTPDPAGEIIGRVVDELKSKAIKTPQVPNANFLVNDEGSLQVWKRKKDGKLCVFLTLENRSDKSKMFEELVTKTVKINKLISKN